MGEFKATKSIAVVLVLAGLILYASGDDLEQLQDEDARWCDNIENGVWFASQEEIVGRCE